MYQIEDKEHNLLEQLMHNCEHFGWYSLALDVTDTVQLLIFIFDINTNFEIAQELLLIESMKDTTTDNLLMKVKRCMEKIGLTWEKFEGSLLMDLQISMAGMLVF